ncbi:hypothetical protein ZIOFF_059227 [Zingiber officinale]|uniref:U-box domain-containing protein n=1 Tax=Zingiber officinale TaxID=94328 RepID=A0A8J5KB79_ZINOF|nr:hypothetical protein ZIOFF_059227 [Zingiber officinale]
MLMMVVECSPEILRLSQGEGATSAGAFAAHAGDSSRRFLVSPDADDVVGGLISDLESSSVESQRRAAMELRLLAKHSADNRLRIARAGAIAPLVALLSHPDPLLQEHGVTAILNLSLCDDNMELIAAAGAVRHLVRALRSGTPQARENSACALLHLAQTDDLRASIGRAGAIPPLVALLETGGARGKKDAATALFSLLAADENKLRAVEAGVVRPLLDLMADPQSGMVDKAAYVLYEVVSSPDGRAAAVEESAIPVLVEMVESGSRRQKDLAMLSLLEICEASAAYRRMVVREGAIPPLIALAQNASKKNMKQKVENLTSFTPNYFQYYFIVLIIYSPRLIKTGGGVGRALATADRTINLCSPIGSARLVHERELSDVVAIAIDLPRGGAGDAHGIYCSRPLN